jgi:TolB protein
VLLATISLPPLVTRVYAQHEHERGGKVVFYSARDGHSNKQIYVMNPDGTDQLRVTYDTASDVDPDLSPNGYDLIFTSDQTQTGNTNIFLRNRWGVVRNVTQNSATDEWARWSPDGKRMVFDSNRDGNIFEIFVMNVDGNTAATRLTDTSQLSRFADWSPDGDQVAFRRGIDIYAMYVDGGTPRQLTHEVKPGFAQMPVWSPDGRYIAFMSFREGYCSVFRMEADGSDQINLTPKNPDDAATSWCSRTPAWSSDGQHIFFMSIRPSTNGQSEIFVMNANGSDVRQLTNTGVNGSPRMRLHRNGRDEDGRPE